MTTLDRRRGSSRKEFLSVPIEVKSADGPKRQVELYSATWDLDLGDDVIHKGAFKRTINLVKRGAKHIPLIDSHRYDSIFHVLGDLIEAEEDARGLKSLWQVIDGADGERAMDRVQGRAVRKASIGYVPVTADFSTMKVDGKEREVRNLREINWEETSLVIFPMNPEADVTAVKTFDELVAGLKAGTLSDADRTHLRELLDAPHAGTPPSPDDAPDSPAPEPKGLSPEAADALRARLMRLTLRRLATPHLRGPGTRRD